MDVRGLAESHDTNNSLSQVRRDQLRFESSKVGTQPPQFTRHSSAPEIVQLVERLRDIPEVREELVTQVIAKLREGHYSTRESAEETATAVLRTLSKE